MSKKIPHQREWYGEQKNEEGEKKRPKDLEPDAQIQPREAGPCQILQQGRAVGEHIAHGVDGVKPGGLCAAGVGDHVSAYPARAERSCA